MRTLLVCTDFSSQSYHAARYAMTIARQYHVPSVTLFHAYRGMPAPTSMLPHQDEEQQQQKAVHFQLHQQMQDLLEFTSQETKVLVRAEKMPLAENINELCEEENADMVLIGLTAKTGLERSLLGDNMINILRNCRCPVCVVPPQASLTPVSEILFAYDRHHVPSDGALARLREILSWLQVPVTVLSVEANNSSGAHDQREAVELFRGMNMRHQPVYESVQGGNVAASIFNFASHHNISMIVTMPGVHNIFEEVFHRSTSQQIIYQSMIPVLSVHE